MVMYLAVLSMKSVLKGTHYKGIKSRTKLYEKIGGRTKAVTDFYALKPSKVIYQVSPIDNSLSLFGVLIIIWKTQGVPQ